MAAAASRQAIFRPNSRTCLSMQFACKWNRSSVLQVPVLNLVDCNSSESLARPLIFTSPSRGKFFVYASRNSDVKTNEDELKLKENSEDVNDLEEKKQMQKKKSEWEELGQDFVATVKPLIRVLNGSTSLMPTKKSVLKSFLNAFVRTMSGSAWTESSKAEFGKGFREVEANFRKALYQNLMEELYEQYKLGRVITTLSRLNLFDSVICLVGIKLLVDPIKDDLSYPQCLTFI